MRTVAMRGSGEVRCRCLARPVLAVSIAGTGDIRVDRMDVNVLGVSIAGSGDFAAAGQADEQGYSIAGNGDVNASDLVGQTVKVRIAGSGDARVHAEQMLVVSIAGSGDVDLSRQSDDQEEHRRVGRSSQGALKVAVARPGGRQPTDQALANG